jgi:hypothetical protein
LDRKVETFKRKTSERYTLLSEAMREYQEDIDELDREIAHLNNAENREIKLRDADYEDMYRRYKRERNEREMLEELLKGKKDASRITLYRLKEEFKKTQD